MRRLPASPGRAGQLGHGVAQDVAQAQERAADAGLGGAQRDAQPLRDLDVGEAAEEGELERLPLGGGQLLDGGADALAAEVEPRLVVHVVVGLVELEVHVRGALADVGLAAHEVDGLVAREGEQPRARRRRGPGRSGVASRHRATKTSWTTSWANRSAPVTW